MSILDRFKKATTGPPAKSRSPNIEQLRANGDIAGLKAALSHNDSEPRERAGEALAGLGAAGVETLLEASRERASSWNSSYAAKRALGKVEGDEGVDVLLTAFTARSVDDWVLDEVVTSLGRSGRAEAVTPLAAFLRKGRDIGIMNAVARALGRLGGDEAIAALRDCVRTGASGSVAAMEALEGLGVGPGEDLSPEEREAVESAQLAAAVQKRVLEWDSAIGGDACTVCHGKIETSALAKRVPVYPQLVAQGFASERKPWNIAAPEASSRDRLGHEVFCSDCAHDLARFMIDVEAGRVTPTEVLVGPMGERYCSNNCYELGGQTVARHLIQGWTGDCSVCRGDLSIGVGQSGSMVCYKPGLFLYFHQQPSCVSAVQAELAKGTECVVCGNSVVSR